MLANFLLKSQLMLAQVQVGGGVGRTWGLGEILVAIVVFAACIALVYVAMQQFGITIPPVLIKVLWIVGVAVLIIVAIRFVLTL